MLIYNDDNFSSDDTPTPTWGGGSNESSRVSETSNLKGKILFTFIISVAFVVAGWLAFKPAEEVKTVAKVENEHAKALSDLEEKKDYVNLIKALYENVDPKYSEAILPWLKQRDDSGFTPYLYATARHMLLTNETYQALLYYTAAGLSARVDAARCSDRTTASWVAFLENGFQGVHDYMGANPSSKEAAGKWALMKEESLKDRDLPEWMCLNGEKPSEYVPYVSEELWQQERVQIRAAFQQFIQENSSASNLADTAPASGK